MNRKERRKSGNKDRVKTYVLTQDQIDQMKDEATQRAADAAFVVMMCIPVLVVKDKYGFDKEQISDFVGHVVSWYESVQNGEVKFREIIKVLEEESDYQLIQDASSKMYDLWQKNDK